MNVQQVITAREILEVVHFTTNRGVLGILDTKLLKSRQRLNSDERLEFIFKANAAYRERDKAWLDYVNLSISRINSHFFARSAGNWHKFSDLWWCVLSFSPEILTHDGVVFTTTNNIYSDVQRSSGVVGLERAFGKSIRWYNQIVVTRNTETPSHFTTCEQAEVLYPGQISTEFLQRIYVPSNEIEDELVAQMSAVGHHLVPIEVCPQMFSNLK